MSNKSIITFLVFQLFFISSSFATVVDKAELNRHALEQGFGFKYANLMQLEKLSQENFGAYAVRVPEFTAITEMRCHVY